MQMHWFVAAAVDLPPTGEPRWNGKALSLPGLIFFYKIRHLGAWSDKAHGPDQYIE